ncbi:hypothetical protein M8013_14465 [Enterobacteriaceae bacterium H4N4]|uniref:Uncharacterized protein n=1 Tax=Silvania confinis TaxID=2926470 RepID=A0A9J6QI82_9ENTR|nr:hypothetical protein [Silvania confinis]MCU6669947.1 hypothetical protein [Silvania confinis]
MSDSLNNKELIAVGHEFARTMGSDTPIIDMAKIVTRLAERLDCTTAALGGTQAQRDQLAAENAALKAAFDKPQAYLSWHAIPPTWEDPLPCGEYLDVHDEAGHKNSDGTDCWPVFAKPETETPATDVFLAEVRAQGVDDFAADTGRLYQTFSPSSAQAKALKSMVYRATAFAAQLRQGGAE